MEEEFRNDQLDVSLLPSIETLNLTPLHKDYLTAKMMGAILFWLLIGIAVLSAILFKGDEFPDIVKTIVPSVLGVIVLSRFAILYFGFKKMAYALREKDVLYKEGLIWRSNTVIPFNRIQHAEVSQGPIERLFGLSNLHVFTAGGSSSDISIPGLTQTEANRIKEYILGKTANTDEEE